jgi:hypothetical protein
MVSGAPHCPLGTLALSSPTFLVGGPVKYQHVFIASLGNHSHGAACLVAPVDNIQSQAVVRLFITRLETRTKESAGHACEESYL